MFDFNWSEIALVGIVALVLIGPKDMPVALRALSATIRRIRRMAGDFQHHVDDMMRDADLKEMRDSINEIRGMNVRGMVRDAVDPDRSISRSFDDPFAERPLNPPTPPAIASTVPGPDIPPPLAHTEPAAAALEPPEPPPVAAAPAEPPSAEPVRADRAPVTRAPLGPDAA